MSTNYITINPVNWDDIIDHTAAFGFKIVEADASEGSTTFEDADNNRVLIWHDPKEREGHAVMGRFGDNDPGDLANIFYSEHDDEFHMLVGRLECNEPDDDDTVD